MSPRHRADRPTAVSPRVAAAVVAVPALAGAMITGPIDAIPIKAVAAVADQTPTSTHVAVNDTVLKNDTPNDGGSIFSNESETAFIRAAQSRSASDAREAIERAQNEQRLAAEAEAARKAEEQRVADEKAVQERREAEKREQERQAAQEAEDEAEEESEESQRQIARETPEPDNAPEAEPRPSQSADAGSAAAIIASGKRFLGLPYVWGGTSPSGFDCSGLTQYIYAKHGVKLPRVSKDQAKVGTRVSASEARAGDLVFFGGSNVHHVGVYLGNGQMLHSPKRGDVVKISKVWNDGTFYKRVL